MRDSDRQFEQTARREAGEIPCAMATVVKTTGSAYRRPGARMFLYADGRREGSISGGCLEADVAERARKTLETGCPVYVMYDTSGESGDVFFETGCSGAIGILIEPLANTNAALYLEWIKRCQERRETAVIATIYRVSGDYGAFVGSRFLLHELGPTESNITDKPLNDALCNEAQTLFQSANKSSHSIALLDGKAEVLLEKLLPPVQLLICGAGQDAIPLAQCAAALGWRTIIADHRESFLTSDRFPAPAKRIETRPENLRDHFIPDARTVAVIMTHHAGHDRDYLRLLLPSDVAYIGLLGPKRRGERLLNELRESGFCPELEHLARLRSPAGLDIGAESPEEIAVSLIAEIQAALAGRPGGALRERGGPIHLPPEPAPDRAETPLPEENAEGFSCPLSA